jgi:hypothetical protein
MEKDVTEMWGNDKHTHVVPQPPAVKQVMIDPERTAWRSGMESGFSLSRFWASYIALRRPSFNEQIPPQENQLEQLSST